MMRHHIEEPPAAQRRFPPDERLQGEETTKKLYHDAPPLQMRQIVASATGAQVTLQLPGE